MKHELTAALPNSVALIMDHESGEPPESMTGGLVAVGASCIAVGTLAEQSGPTRFILTDDGRDVDQTKTRLAFEGEIAVTSGAVSLVNVLNEKLLTLPASPGKVRVRVFVNDDTEPDQVAVIVG